MEGTGDAFVKEAGVERELEEEEVDEEVDEEREGTVGMELNTPSSSSVSRMEGSHVGTGVQGCQPGATEQDLASGGLRSSLCTTRGAREAL